jgi:hypothetical protein
VRYKETDGAGGYEPGAIVVNEAIDATEGLKKLGVPAEFAERVASYIREGADGAFWPLVYQVDDRQTHLDGAQWVIEGTRGDMCHVVTRQSPDRNEPFREFAEYLMRASGKRYYYDEVY